MRQKWDVGCAFYELPALPVGFWRTRLSCGYCRDGDALDLTTTPPPDVHAINAWILTHARCEERAEEAHIRRNLRIEMLG